MGGRASRSFHKHGGLNMTVQEKIQKKAEGYVDLGLPSGTKWAKCNLGAERETDYGHYYMWGSIIPNTPDECTWENAPLNGGRKKFNLLYFDYNKSSWLDNDDNLKPEYDAAYQATGGVAHMPTAKQFKELKNNTTRKWVTIDGVSGYKFISKTNGNSIFFPICGYYDNGGVYLRESYSSTSSGSYWSSSRRESDFSDEALSLHFNLGYVNPYSSCPHKYGFCIRPVIE